MSSANSSIFDLDKVNAMFAEHGGPYAVTAVCTKGQPNDPPLPIGEAYGVQT